VETLKAKHGIQFDASLLDAFIQIVQSDRLQGIVGHSELGVPLVACPSCGPVITVSRDFKDGNMSYCRVCGSKHRLHRDGDTFTVEPTGEMGSADELKPQPETGSIEAFVSKAPRSVNI
jgi:hypothetical protein